MAADGIGLFGRIAAVKRAMPRNGDVMAICAALERLLTMPKLVDATPASAPSVDATRDCPVCAERRAGKAAAQKRWRGKRADK